MGLLLLLLLTLPPPKPPKPTSLLLLLLLPLLAQLWDVAAAEGAVEVVQMVVVLMTVSVQISKDYSHRDNDDAGGEQGYSVWPLRLVVWMLPKTRKGRGGRETPERRGM